MHPPCSRTSTIGPRAVGDQDRLVVRIGRGKPVTATHQAGIERDHVEQGAETELLLNQAADGPALGPEQAGVEEELARVVAGLAVDVDRPGEVGGLPIVEPVGIGEPGVGLRQDDELAGTRVVQPDLAAALRPARTRATPGCWIKSSRTRSRSWPGAT